MMEQRCELLRQMGTKDIGSIAEESRKVSIGWVSENRTCSIRTKLIRTSNLTVTDSQNLDYR